jgi:steroid delta-isomerase-like uncharacterized protein
MMTTPVSSGSMVARLKIVDEHVRLENEHNLDGIIETFGETARYDDEPWDVHYIGRQEVREFYAQLLRAMPDLHIDVRRRHAAEEAVVLEVIIRARHSGTWRGLPATGRQISFPLCGVYTFDKGNQLAGEKIYYDRATVLRQLGVFHEPESLPGRITTLLAHPLTMARIVTQKTSWVAPWAAARKTTPL